MSSSSLSRIGTLLVTFYYLALLSASVSSNVLPLPGRSFALRSTIRTALDKGYLFVNHIYESYSIEQRRGKIGYQLDPHRQGILNGIPLNGSVYLADDSNQALLVADKFSECRSFNRSDLFELIFGFKSELMNAEPEVAANFLIGPAWLIYFLAKYRQEFRPSPEPAPKVRNIPARMYIFDYKLNYGAKEETFHFLVLYSADKVDGGDSIPLQLNIQAKNLWVTIDFKKYESGLQSTASSANDHLSNPMLDLERSRLEQENSVDLDEFNFARFASLSRYLSEHGKFNLPRGRNKTMSRFSFMAKYELEGKALSAFVAYDGALDSMRYEISNLGPDKTGVRKQIFSLNLNRMYHLIEKVPKSGTRLDRIIELAIEDKKAESLDDEPAGRGRSTHCSTVQIKSPKPGAAAAAAAADLSLGDLLFGASNFVYMGQARVRGIQARVYEFYGANLPFWLEQSVVYYDLAGEQQIRRAGVSEPFIYNTQIYVAENEFAPIRPHLLLIEIATMTKDESATIVSRRQIFIHQFAWDLPDRAPNGDRAIDFFSLEDQCSSLSSSAGEEEDEKLKTLQVELLLDSESQLFDLSDWSGMHNARQRNLALLASLQSGFKLPATMIYDLGSQIIQRFSANEYDEQDRVAQVARLVSVSFKIAQHPKQVSTISFLGNGRAKSDWDQQLSKQLVRSFQACFFLASHRGASIYFGYDELTHRCFIDLEPIKGGEKPKAFAMLGSAREMEIFRLQQSLAEEEVEKLSNRTDWLRSARSRALMLGRKVNLVIGADLARHETVFTIKRLKVSSLDGVPLDSRRLDSNDRIVGYGFVEQTGLSKRIYPPKTLDLASVGIRSPGEEEIDDQVMMSEPQISEPQCQTACLADPACRSYSICALGHETKCIISNVDLKFSGAPMRSSSSSSSSRQQLADLALSGGDKPPSRGSIVNLTLDHDHSVAQLIVHPNCAIHSKSYLSLFQAPNQINSVGLSGERVFLVASEEQCASLCLQRNAQVLEQIEASSTDSANSDSESAKISTRNHRLISLQFCYGFSFLAHNAANSSESNATLSTIDQQVALKDRLVSASSAEALAGYCLLTVRSTRTNIDASAKTGLHAQFSRRALRMELLYERRYGFSLKSSPQTGVKNEGAQVDARNANLLDNSAQSVIEADESKCARICYLHLGQRWPPCKTFDIIVRSDPLIGRSTSYCYLNSIALSDILAAKRLDLIDDHRLDRDAQVWHYELHDALAQLEVPEWSSNQVGAARPLGAYKSAGSKSWTMFVGFCVVLIGISSGILLAVQMNGKFIRQQPNWLRDDAILYNPSRESIEISSQPELI